MSCVRRNLTVNVRQHDFNAADDCCHMLRSFSPEAGMALRTTVSKCCIKGPIAARAGFKTRVYKTAGHSSSSNFSSSDPEPVSSWWR